MQNPHTSDDDADDSIAEGQQNKELFGYTVGGRITITTLVGSITDERVDVIVNTTRSDLDLSAGIVSPAILKAAGPSIQLEIKKRARTLKPGHIIETGAGKLPAGRIFHGVVKRWDGPNGTSMESLSQVMRKCLDAAHGANQGSIAFPAIGAGCLGNPPESCAKVMHDEVLLFFGRHPRSSVDNVHFVLDPSDGAVMKAFTAERQELESGGGETGLVGLLMLGRKKEPLGDITKATGQRNKDLFGYTVGSRITVTTLAGSITDERVDVIVNVTHSDQNLSASGVSAATLEAAGTSVPSWSNLDPGDIIATDAGTLPAGSIIHGVVKDGPNGTSLASLSEVMRKCLDAVHAANKDSIAFSAIGAGGLQNPPESCAEVMHEEVLLFLRRHPRSSVDNVHFVLNPSDDTVIEAFTAKHQEIVSGKGKTAGAESEETITESIQVPPYWKTRDQKSRMPRLIPVEPSDEDYILIKEKLVASGVTKTLKSITRIENMYLYQEYAVRKTRFQKDCPEGTKVERMLFHGTKADVINDINTNGFSRSYSGSANAAVYGNGVYFAVDPAYSAQEQYSPPDANKVKHIYQCRVLTGAFCEGDSGLKAPPQIPSLPDGVRYDSVVDDKDEPTMFVIFRDSQAYPEYLIQLLDTEVERKLLDTKVQPKLLDTKVQPKLLDTKVQPELLDTKVQRKLLDTKVQPKLLDTKVQPKLLDTKVQPKLLNTKKRAKLLDKLKKVERERKLYRAYGVPYKGEREVRRICALINMQV